MPSPDFPSLAPPQPAAAGDFLALLARQGLAGHPVPEVHGPLPPQTEATTILAFKFKGGILVAGDRRATAGNVVVYDRADKVLEIDRHSLMAIAGVPATAWEMARTLGHSFQFYRRSQLQEMSLEGKVRALSRLLRENVGLVMQGIGVVVPIFATFDLQANLPRLYFYDAMGAEFEATDFAASGSGSPAVRAILYYANTYGPRPLARLNEEDALLVALRALDTAAENDTATGSVDRHGRVYPVIKIVNATGIVTLPDRLLAKAYQRNLASLPKHTPKFADLE